MTACTNNGGKARRVVTAALVGVLSVGAAPMVALATGNDVSLMASNEDNWQGGTFTFDREANADGSYTVTSGDTLSFVSAKDVNGTEYGLSDVTVLYFQREAAETGIPQNCTATDAGTTFAGRAGSMPEDAGLYWAVVFQGDAVDASGNLVNLTDTTQFSAVRSSEGAYKAFKLTVADKTTSLDGAEAFQFDATADDEGRSDETLNYTGGSLNVSFKVANETLDASKYGIVWTAVPQGASTPRLDSTGKYFPVTEAGTYTAKLTGKGGANGYSGSVEVSFEVQGIDLATADVSIAPKDDSVGFNLGGDLTLDASEVTVNGVQLDNNAPVTVTVIAKDDAQLPGTGYNTLKTPGKYTFRLTANAGQSNITGTRLVDTHVVNEIVNYSYFGKGSLASVNDLGIFNPAKGSVFTPDAFGATVGSDEVPFTVTVTKDGQAVTSYDAAGEYVVTLDTAVGETESGTSYAGHKVVTFTVAGASYADAQIFASWQGKNIADGASLEYTGDAVTPTVVVRDSKKGTVYAEGEDYTWALLDEEGNEVESATEVGTYTIKVTYNGTAGEEELSFSVGKVAISGVKAAADFFALPEDGSAATPSFVGVTADGDEVELAADQISVRYYTKWNTNSTTGEFTSVVPSSRVNAEDLTKAGTYYASVTVLSNASQIQASGEMFCPVVVSEAAGFADVDANEWYAGPIYKAKDLEYMTGAGGTNLFMPHAKITRAELACVMFNMAGKPGYTRPGETFPTKFTDVPSDTWFSQAVAWASEHGVVNGHGDTFAPYDNATREEVACFLYNYAQAKGDDVSVDVDAVLAEYPDGDKVSGWARTAVAWAADRGVSGNNGSLNPQGVITRSEVAAMTVNYQPEAVEIVD